MMSLQQITCSIAVSGVSGCNKNYRNIFAEKLKSKPKATEERNACLTVCDDAETDVRQSDYHFTDRDKLYDAPNQGFGKDIELFKFIKRNVKLEGCARVMFFSILIAKIRTLNTVRFACRKDPGTFVCCEVLRPNQHYQGHIEPVSKFTRQPKKIKRIFFNIRFRKETCIIKIF